MCLPLSPAGNSQAPCEPAGPSGCFPQAGAFGGISAVPPWAAPGSLRGGHPVASRGPCPRQPVAGQREMQEALETKQRPRFSPWGSRGGLPASPDPNPLPTRPREAPSSLIRALRALLSSHPSRLSHSFKGAPCRPPHPLSAQQPPWVRAQLASPSGWAGGPG